MSHRSETSNCNGMTKIEGSELLRVLDKRGSKYGSVILPLAVTGMANLEATRTSGEERIGKENRITLRPYGFLTHFEAFGRVEARCAKWDLERERHSQNAFM